MSKKIAILLALAVYCCLHSLANGYANREESVNGGRQPPKMKFYWWECKSSEDWGGKVGEICLAPDHNPFDVVERCRAKFPKAKPPVRIVIRTDSRC